MTPARKKPAAGDGMKRFQSAESQRRHSRQAREAGQKIGLVPTMGAFHEGHLSLIRRARGQNDLVVVSIFVNPIQFGPDEDYERYPRDLARDLDRAREAGADAVFLPEVEEMYPPGFSSRVTVGPITERLCGATRPGHFDGVCTVVLKLLGIVLPHRVYLGEKDAQQLIVLQKMVDELNVDVKIVPCPTVREKDGLAMSSRNAYLTEEERALAPRIYRALRFAQREILVGGERDPERLRARMTEQLTAGAPLAVEYLAMVDPETLEDRATLSGRTLIAVAVGLGRARLIDNLLIHVPGGRMAEKVRLSRERP
jgi:pantoate--beta-alanine ligase